MPKIAEEDLKWNKEEKVSIQRKSRNETEQEVVKKLA